MAEAERQVWKTDAASLRDVVLDREAVQSRLDDCPALERIWILSLLGRTEEAIEEGHALLRSSTDQFRPLLVLAQAYQQAYRWHEAATLQENALQLAGTRAREALVRHQIGRRLFDEALYWDAAAEFEWAYDLYRAVGRDRLAQASLQALERARAVATNRSLIP